MELYSGIIFMKRILGMPGTCQEPPGSPGILGTPLRHPGTHLGPPGTPLGPLGTPLGPPGMLLGPLGTRLGAPRDAPMTPRTPMDHKNGLISTSIRRQKLSIAVFKPAC